jgi:bacterioferritin-associated ferredoxin
MVVCHCERVTDRRVAKAVRAGHRSVRSVCEETGAGQACGGCVSSVKKLIEQHFRPNLCEENPHEAA